MFFFRGCLEAECGGSVRALEDRLEVQEGSAASDNCALVLKVRFGCA